MERPVGRVRVTSHCIIEGEHGSDGIRIKFIHLVILYRGSDKVRAHPRELLGTANNFFILARVLGDFDGNILMGEQRDG